MHSHHNHYVTTLQHLFLLFYLSGQSKNCIVFFFFLHNKRKYCSEKNIAVLILGNGWRAGVLPGVSSAKATLCTKEHTVLDHPVLCVCICIAVLDLNHANICALPISGGSGNHNRFRADQLLFYIFYF